jgi:hydrogenase maturation protein HypF
MPDPLSAPFSDPLGLGRTAGLPLPPGPPVVAVGAHAQCSVCVAGPSLAWLSPPLADLDTPEAWHTHQHWTELGLQQLRATGHGAQAVAHDLHPDAPSTRTALALAHRHGAPLLAVQHHHAHLAAAWAEHAAHEGPPQLLGLALDGMGLGHDGQAWGGELLHLNGPHAHRIGHLQALPLPGGDAAARQPWRLAVAALHGIGLTAQAHRHAQAHATAAMAQAIGHLLRRPQACPSTTSLGRWFDATASLLGLCHTRTHPAEAAQALEAAAQRHGPHAPMAQGWRVHHPAHGPQVLDLSPLWRALADTPHAPAAAACFHATLIAALAEWLQAAAHARGLRTVALGGGCLHNRLLRGGLVERLSAAGLRCLVPRRLPPGDGAIAYGQAVVARLVLAYH